MRRVLDREDLFKKFSLSILFARIQKNFQLLFDVCQDANVPFLLKSSDLDNARKLAESFVALKEWHSPGPKDRTLSAPPVNHGAFALVSPRRPPPVPLPRDVSELPTSALPKPPLSDGTKCDSCPHVSKKAARFCGGCGKRLGALPTPPAQASRGKGAPLPAPPARVLAIDATPKASGVSLTRMAPDRPKTAPVTSRGSLSPQKAGSASPTRMAPDRPKKAPVTDFVPTPLLTAESEEESEESEKEGLGESTLGVVEYRPKRKKPQVPGSSSSVVPISKRTVGGQGDADKLAEEEMRKLAEEETQQRSEEENRKRAEEEKQKARDAKIAQENEERCQKLVQEKAEEENRRREEEDRLAAVLTEKERRELELKQQREKEKEEEEKERRAREEKEREEAKKLQEQKEFEEKFLKEQRELEESMAQQQKENEEDVLVEEQYGGHPTTYDGAEADVVDEDDPAEAARKREEQMVEQAKPIEYAVDPKTLRPLPSATASPKGSILKTKAGKKKNSNRKLDFIVPTFTAEELAERQRIKEERQNKLRERLMAEQQKVGDQWKDRIADIRNRKTGERKVIQQKEKIKQKGWETKGVGGKKAKKKKIVAGGYGGKSAYKKMEVGDDEEEAEELGSPSEESEQESEEEEMPFMTGGDSPWKQKPAALPASQKDSKKKSTSTSKKTKAAVSRKSKGEGGSPWGSPQVTAKSSPKSRFNGSHPPTKEMSETSVSRSMVLGSKFGTVAAKKSPFVLAQEREAAEKAEKEKQAKEKKDRKDRPKKGSKKEKLSGSEVSSSSSPIARSPLREVQISPGPAVAPAKPQKVAPWMQKSETPKSPSPWLQQNTQDVVLDDTPSDFTPIPMEWVQEDVVVFEETMVAVEPVNFDNPVVFEPSSVAFDPSALPWVAEVPVTGHVETGGVTKPTGPTKYEVEVGLGSSEEDDAGQEVEEGGEVFGEFGGKSSSTKQAWAAWGL